jgi:hypothetical protein
MTRFIVSSSDLINGEEELLKVKKFIILDEALKQFEKNNANQIRYSELKKLCNNRLADLTNGDQTDFGGSFDKFIEYLESKEEPSKRVLRREKKSPKKTFIILDVPKVLSLLSKKGINNSEDSENDFVQSLGPPDDFSGMNIVRTEDKGGLVFFEYKRVSPTEEKGYNEPRCKMNNSPALISYPWVIHTSSPNNESFRLDEESIQQLLLLGKAIASKDKTMPFKITLEYEGVLSIQKNFENAENIN